MNYVWRLWLLPLGYVVIYPRIVPSFGLDCSFAVHLVSHLALYLRLGWINTSTFGALPKMRASHSYTFFSQSSAFKTSNKLVITSVAFQDHISRSLLHPGFSLSDSLLKSKRNTAIGREGHDETEYVLDSAPSPLTLGKRNTGRRGKLLLCALP